MEIPFPKAKKRQDKTPTSPSNVRLKGEAEIKSDTKAKENWKPQSPSVIIVKTTGRDVVLYPH
jgi:hypothetical protein